MKKLSSLVLALAAAATAQAETVSFQDSRPLETTEIHQTLSLGLFDSNLGVLTGIALSINGQMLTDITLTNKATQNQRVTAVGTVDLNFSSDLSSLNLLFAASNPLALVATLKDVGLASNQTSVFNNQRDRESSLFDSQLNSFWSDFSRAGGGLFNVSCESLSGISVSGGGGNIQASQETQASCGAAITYTYGPPNPVPEPASLALVALAMVGATAVTRRRQR